MKETVKKTPQSEFARPRWSVVSMEECAASNLNYDEAVKLVRKMSDSISGLCIVTDESAARLSNKQKANGNSELPRVAAPNTFAETL